MGRADTTVDLKKVFATQDESAVLEMAKELVNIPSQTGEEGPIGDYVARRFEELGLRVQLQEVEPGRNNVIARQKGTGDGPTLMFLAHFDTSTNPGENLPFGFQAKALVQDGWIYGLGISNMKNAFAGYFSALQMLRDSGVKLKGDIVVAGVVGEIEKAPIDNWQGARYRGGGFGARFMLNHGVTADFCINGEPTGMRLQTANAGYIFARVGIKGSSQSTFSRHVAVDTIPRAFKLHAAIGRWEAEYQKRHPHPFMQPLISVGAIYGGYPYKPSLTAGFCNLYVHINTIPGQDILGVQRELEEVVAQERMLDAQLDATVDLYFASNGYEISVDHPLAHTVAAAHREVTGIEVIRPTPERYSCSSDNSPLAEFGIPGITYGAGGKNRSGQWNMYEPGVGELVSIDNLKTAARVYATSAIRLCSVD